MATVRDGRTDAEELAFLAENGWSLEAHHLLSLRKGETGLAGIPEAGRTERICHAAVVRDGMDLQYAPQHFRTEEICLAAVQQNGDAFEFVPDGMKTDRVCRAALEQKQEAAKAAREAAMAKALAARKAAAEAAQPAVRWLDVVRRDGRKLKDVPMDARSLDVCRAAAARTVAAMPHVPRTLRTASWPYASPHGPGPRLSVQARTRRVYGHIWKPRTAPAALGDDQGMVHCLERCAGMVASRAQAQAAGMGLRR